MFPEILIKTAISIDACIDDTSTSRKIFSSRKDAEEVDVLRAEYDAILVGAGTLRSDNPNLVVRSKAACSGRLRKGLLPTPWKITITASGDLSRSMNFFQTGDTKKIVYASKKAVQALTEEVGSCAEVVSAPREGISAEFIARDLYIRGVRRLMVEGGMEVITLFLNSGLVSKIRLAVAPFFIAEPKAPWFYSGDIASQGALPFKLESAYCLDDTSVFWYQKVEL